MDLEKHPLTEDYSSAHSILMRPYQDIVRNDSPSTENSDGGSSGDNVRQSHGHCHENDTVSLMESHEKRFAKRRLIMACIVSLLFMVGEMIGGYAAHSLAIMTDAAHLLTDFGSIIISLFSLWISNKPPTKNMTFGWHRAEILGALLSLLSIWAVTGVLVFVATQRIMNDDYEIHSHIMVITSGCAVGVNILMALILHQSGSSHGHSHGLSYSQPKRDSHSHGNTSVRAAFIHVVGDLLQSIGVLLASIIIYFWPKFKIADPLCTFLFSLLVLGTTFKILKDILRILMEGVPKDTNIDTVRALLLSVRGVKATHNLHMWGLSMSHSLLSVHVAIEEDANPQMVLMESTDLLRSEFGFSSITVQVEQFSDDMVYCTQCQDLTD